MATYERFEELPVWQQAKTLATMVYKVTSQEPFRRDFGFVSQITRAALSVSSNIAEGFERGTTKELVHYLNISRGSCGEVRSQLAVAKDLGYLDTESCEQLHRLCVDTSRQLASFADYLLKRKPNEGNSTKL